MRRTRTRTGGREWQPRRQRGVIRRPPLNHRRRRKSRTATSRTGRPAGPRRLVCDLPRGRRSKRSVPPRADSRRQRPERGPFHGRYDHHSGGPRDTGGRIHGHDGAAPCRQSPAAIAFFKRRSARNLRCLLGYVAFVELLVASIATGIVNGGPDSVGHHIVISLVFAAAGIRHGVRHATARRRRASRRVSAKARPERVID